MTLHHVAKTPLEKCLSNWLIIGLSRFNFYFMHFTFIVWTPNCKGFIQIRYIRQYLKNTAKLRESIGKFIKKMIHVLQKRWPCNLFMFSVKKKESNIYVKDQDMLTSKFVFYFTMWWLLKGSISVYLQTRKHACKRKKDQKLFIIWSNTPQQAWFFLCKITVVTFSFLVQLSE